MGKGELLFPEYSEMFGQGSKLQKVSEYPAVSKLREQWKEVFEKNKKIYEDLRDEEFDNKPENMTEETSNYFKTKGKVLMAWQLHQMYHGRQLSVLAAIAGKKMF